MDDREMFSDPQEDRLFMALWMDEELSLSMDDAAAFVVRNRAILWPAPPPRRPNYPKEIR